MTIETMRAATTPAYGPPEVVRVARVPRPRPGPGEVLVRVSATPVTRGDARLRGNDAPAGFGPLLRLAFGLRRPRNPVQGMEFAGVVETPAGGLASGDRVFGVTGLKGSAHAEYLTIPAAGRIFRTPETLTDAEAAAFFFGGLTAADFLIDKARLAPDERVLINGATGAVGSAAIQIARHLGARVTAVCSPANADFARWIGAEEVFDYGAGGIAGAWDVVMDVAGTLPYPRAAALLRRGGRLLPVTATLREQISYVLQPRRGGHRITGGTIAETRPAMERLLALHTEGAYQPVVGAVLPFERIAAAHALAGSGHKRGSVVVRIEGDPA